MRLSQEMAHDQDEFVISGQKQYKVVLTLQAEPYQRPPCPPIGGARCHRGPNISPDATKGFLWTYPHTKLQPPKMEIYETLDINEIFINPYSILSCNLQTEK